MWLFTKHGFYSVVKHESKELFMVRARCRGHLEKLIDVCSLSENVVETPDNDYRFRITVGAAALSLIVEDLAMEIDYPNFKDACKKDVAYHSALHTVWNAMWVYEKKINGS